MRIKRSSLTLLFILTLAAFTRLYPARAQGIAIEVSNERAVIRFPETITFQATLQSDTTIHEVVLEYGVEMQTCGTVIAKSFPRFTPGQTVNAEWTWEMKQSGSLPPGASIWWRWRIVNQDGQEATTPIKEVTWLDNEHNWQTIIGDGINLHWYKGSQQFGQELHTAAVQALQRLNKDAGLTSDQPIDLYIYADYNDLGDAILYEPSWTGGMAFPEHNIVIIGIAPNNLEWGKRTEAHELTHVLVGHLTFSCIGDVPTWLNEGLAVYSEGPLDAYSRKQLETAIADDTLFSVRSLSGAFSEILDKANLSYAESYSIVKFLLESYGRDKMNEMLLALRDGETVDEALQHIYGFDVEGLEDAWRANIGAKPRQAGPQPTATPQPTPVPTIRPVSGAPLAVTPTPFIVPTSSFSGGADETVSPGSIVPLAVIVAVFCCLLALAVLAAIIIYSLTSRQKRSK
ncbi:MAG: peptidase MA family metallohydrolase [Candidatus Villigracilaceae bacterium]